MSWDYVERKVTEALKISRGNATLARKQILAWTYEDTKLLAELTKPHMTGIISHAIGHVVSKAEREGDANAEQPAIITEQDVDEKFGLEILKAIAGGATPRFGTENNAPRVGKQKASQSHVDAINRIASKKKKKDD